MIKYNFIPGSKWVYFKLYCGKSFADFLIGSVLCKLSVTLMEDGIIDKWYFIRYEDPDFHIRFRFRLHNADFFDSATKVVYRELKDFASNRSIWKIQIDTYQREINRYGANNIKFIEAIFNIDSIMISETLKNLDLRERDRILLGMVSMEYSFRYFGLNNNQKIPHVIKVQNIFLQEFDVNLVQKKKLNKYYSTEIKNQLFELLSSDLLVYQYYPQLEKRNKQLQKQINLIDKSDVKMYQSILFGINHMNCNRLFSDRQRIYEMICYDFLRMAYKTLNQSEK